MQVITYSGIKVPEYNIEIRRELPAIVIKIT